MTDADQPQPNETQPPKAPKTLLDAVNALSLDDIPTVFGHDIPEDQDIVDGDALDVSAEMRSAHEVTESAVDADGDFADNVSGDVYDPGDVAGEPCRQRGVGVQEQQYVAGGNGRPGVHLSAATRLRRDDPRAV